MSVDSLGPPRSLGAGRLGWQLITGLLVLGGVMALLVVGFLSLGMWYLAFALLLAGPAFYLLHRYPFAAIMVWLAIGPFLMAGEGGAIRRVYWVVHRALPVGALLVILVVSWLGVRQVKLPKLGWPEMMMAGYLVLTVVSIAYRSLEPMATYIYMYDHVVIPMSLYLLVRLLAPDEEDFKRLVPVLVFFLIAQSVVGILSWVAPQTLPAGWNNREERATGTLRHPNVYGVALLFAGLYLAHYGQRVARHPWVRGGTVWLLALSAAMAVVTLSRASWLAALFVTLGLLFVYPRLSRRLMVGAVIVAVVAVGVGGALGPIQEALSARFSSDASSESALSRLPVVVASLRMIETKPVIGWGYENFDRYDHAFVGSIEGLFVPDRDHASHNLFLTLGAESGLVGLLLYLGPLLWWLAKSRSGARHLPTEGFRSKKFIGILWLAMTAQVIVYNFSNNRVAFGLGVWWLTVGLLATACDWRDQVMEEASTDVERRVAALKEDSLPLESIDA